MQNKGIAAACAGIAIIAVLASGCGSSGPAYVGQLKSDGYTLSDQHTLDAGPVAGYAYGVQGYSGELVIQGRTPQAAEAEYQSFSNTGYVTSVLNGDLCIVDGGADVLRNIMTNSGWK